jgi:hypothetical protein
VLAEENKMLADGKIEHFQQIFLSQMGLEAVDKNVSDFERKKQNFPDDFIRLQNERENLVKMLQVEKDQSKKASDELQQIKHEKIKVESENANLHRQLLQQQNEIKRINEEIRCTIERDDQISRELMSTKTHLEQITVEHEQVIRNMKAQYEATIQRLQKEVTDATSERNDSLQSFNVKSMFSPIQQSATEQQWCDPVSVVETPLSPIHSTEPGELSPNSPISSLTDYMPTTSSGIVTSVPPIGSRQDPTESSSSESEKFEVEFKGQKYSLKPFTCPIKDCGKVSKLNNISVQNF